MRAWRFVVVIAVAIMFVEIFCGVAAYSSSTWDFHHTEVLTGWAAVREVCLVYVPIILAGCLVGGAALAVALLWALGGSR